MSNQRITKITPEQAALIPMYRDAIAPVSFYSTMKIAFMLMLKLRYNLSMDTVSIAIAVPELQVSQSRENLTTKHEISFP